MRFASCLSILVIAAATGCAPKPRGMTMGTFIPDDAIRGVTVCKTTAPELIASFGQPTGQGSDGAFTTLQWSGAAIIADNKHAMTTLQMIYVWVADGMVAGMVVNPVGLPTTPPPCPAGAV